MPAEFKSIECKGQETSRMNRVECSLGRSRAPLMIGGLSVRINNVTPACWLGAKSKSCNFSERN